MKIFKWIYCIVVIFVILVASLLIISTFPIPGNIKFLTVQSGSMEPAIKTGSVVLVKPADDYKIGEVITFGEMTKTKSPVTHRINDIKIVEDEPRYITKGDANNSIDDKEISKDEVIGKVVVSVPFMGYAVDFARKPIGFIFIIIVPAMIIIFDEVGKIYDEVTKKKKKENE